MNIKKIFLLIVVIFVGFGFFSAKGGPSVYADDYLNRKQFLGVYFNVVSKEFPISDSYKDITLKYKNVRESSSLYPFMQKAVYLDIFPNRAITLPLRRKITQGQANTIINSNFDINISYEKAELVTADRLRQVLILVRNAVEEDKNIMQIQLNQGIYMNDSLFDDIYKKLNTDDAKLQNADEKQILYESIKGMVESKEDPYTIFFTPREAQNFEEELRGDYEGIGAYVDMVKPGILIIVSPIAGGPAEHVGLRAGDRIIKINNHRIVPGIDIQTAVNRIKGKENTKVRLLILRENKAYTFVVTRARIQIKNMNTRIFVPEICYMAIGMFGYGVYDEFVDAMKNSFSDDCEKYVFDVRNNPGGSLEEVANILDYFVPTGKPTVIVESQFVRQELIASDVYGKKLINEDVVVLINEWSASASEIFAGTIRDYLPNALLLGQKTFGKGSVQELIEYDDGSMLKYTIAQRYTGKSRTKVDKVGLNPDVLIVDDKKTVLDEQFEYALDYRFK